MSKTKGNVVDPIEIIERFGTDAVRFTLASMASPGTDIAFSEARTEGYRAFANKIWNAARFIFMNMERAKLAGIALDLAQLEAELKLSVDSPIEDRWIIASLTKNAFLVNALLKEYRFDAAASVVYQFFWGDFCDWYLELVKLRLNFDDPLERPKTRASLLTLIFVFEYALRMLSPFMPFITEEIWNALHGGKPPAKSIALTHYPVSGRDDLASVAEYIDETIDRMTLLQILIDGTGSLPQFENGQQNGTKARDVAILQQLITSIRTLRKELAVPEKEPTAIRFHSAPEIVVLAESNAHILSKLARVSAIEIVSKPLTGNNARSTQAFDVAVLYERQIDVPAERERLSRDLAKYEKGLTAAERQLSNESFMAKAPAHIVEGLRKQAAETRTLYEKTKAALDALG
jgi:valyl-tRNA synthetase